MPNSSLKTVIFDLGGVYFTEGAGRFISKLSQSYSVTEEAARTVVHGKLGSDYRIGSLSPEQFWMQAVEFWNIDTDITELSSLWLSCYEPIEGTVEIVQRLAEAGCELLFLSDNAPDRVEYLESRYKFQRHFSAGVFSCDIQTRKPDPAMYHAVLEKTSSAAGNCVYIDDKPEMLAPARELGLHTIHFTEPSALDEALQTLGLRF